MPVRRRMVSGPTKGTVEGRDSIRGVKLIMGPYYFFEYGHLIYWSYNCQ
jgi:hypothetical protein